MNKSPDHPPHAGGLALPEGQAGVLEALDRGVLASLQQLDPNNDKHLMARVLSTYQDSLHRLLGKAEVGHRQQDWPALQMAAHTLKSASASVGALQLAAHCAGIESLLRGAVDSVRLRSLVDHLQCEAQRVDRDVQRLLGMLTPLRP